MSFGFESLRRVATAGLAGIVAGIVDMAALVALVRGPHARARRSGRLPPACGAVVHFVLGKYLAFRDRSSLAFGQILRFASVTLGTALLMGLAMQLLVVDLRLSYVLAKLPASLLVFAAWTYPAQRYFVFRRAGELV